MRFASVESPTLCYLGRCPKPVGLQVTSESLLRVGVYHHHWNLTRFLQAYQVLFAAWMLHSFALYLYLESVI